MEIAPAIHGNGAGVQRHSGIGCGRKAIVAGEEAEQSPMFGDIGFASDRNMRDRLDRSAHLWAGNMDAVERRDKAAGREQVDEIRSEEHTSELQSLMRISYAVFFLKK